jgi:hypothetical protein
VSESSHHAIWVCRSAGAGLKLCGINTVNSICRTSTTSNSTLTNTCTFDARLMSAFALVCPATCICVTCNSGPFLTDMYLCNVCSCQEILSDSGPSAQGAQDEERALTVFGDGCVY